MKYPSIILLTLIFLGCQARGLKPISHSQLNGNYINPVIKTNISQKEIEVISPAKTNVIKVNLAKLEQNIS